MQIGSVLRDRLRNAEVTSRLTTAVLLVPLLIQ
jgi:hypothetical protein